MLRPDTHSLRYMIDSSVEPIVGCNQVVEYIADSCGKEPHYTCTLCDFVTPSAAYMLNHLIGNKHRNAYIDRFENRSQGESVPTRSVDSTRHICCLIEKRMGRMTHQIRTVTSSHSSPAQITTASKRLRIDGDSQTKSASKHQVSSTSQPANTTECGTVGTGLAVSEGPLGELLKKLSKCVVKNESDASMALYVSRALLGSLVEYRSKQHPEMAAKLKEMLRTMGGMLRTMAAVNPSFSSGSVPVTSSTPAPASTDSVQQRSQTQPATGAQSGSLSAADSVAVANTPLDQPPPSLPKVDGTAASMYSAMQTGAAFGAQTMVVPTAMMGNGVMTMSGNMMAGVNPMMAGAGMMTGAGMMAGTNPMMAGASMMCGTGMMGMPNMMGYGANMMTYGPNFMGCNPNMMAGPGMMNYGTDMMGPTPMISGSTMMGPGMKGVSDIQSTRNAMGPDGDGGFKSDRFREGRCRTGGFRGRGGHPSRH